MKDKVPVSDIDRLIGIVQHHHPHVQGCNCVVCIEVRIVMKWIATLGCDHEG